MKMFHQNQHTPAGQKEMPGPSPAGSPIALGLDVTLTDHVAGYHATAAQVTTPTYYIFII